MTSLSQLSLLTLSCLVWLALWPVVVRLTPGATRKIRLDWYQLGGYSVIALWAACAVVSEPMRFHLSAAPGPATIALTYSFFGFMAATSVLMFGAGVELRSLWAHHAVFALLPLLIILGNYWVEMYAWLFASQFTGGVHCLSHILQRAPGGSAGRTSQLMRLEWFMLATVRGLFVGGMTLVFALSELRHPTYAGAGWATFVAIGTLANVAFPIFWCAPRLPTEIARLVRLSTTMIRQVG